MTSEEIQILHDRIVAVKNKYSSEILAIKGVNTVGVKVFEQTITVYVHDATPETLLLIPTELDGFPVECQGVGEPQPSGLPWIDTAIQHHRPVISGRSVDTPLNSGSGTIGATLWSNRLQREVGISCHHVLTSYNQGFITQNSNNSVDFTVVTGGVPFAGVDFQDYFLNDTLNVSPYDANNYRHRWKRYYLANETGANWTNYLYGADYGHPNGTVHINSISPTSAKVGDIVTLAIKVGGKRRGASDILFNGVKAKIKSWNYTWDANDPVNPIGVKPYYTGDIFEFIALVEAYVPDIPQGPIQVIANIEGETVYNASSSDTGGYPTVNQIGNIADYYPFTGVDDKDTAIMTYHPDVALKNEQIMQSAVSDSYGIQTALGFINSVPYHGTGSNDVFQDGANDYSLNGLGNCFPNREYRTQGCYRGVVYEGMVVMKTGRSTGTTFGIVNDVSANQTYYMNSREYYSIDYGGGNPCVESNLMTCYENEFVYPYINPPHDREGSGTYEYPATFNQDLYVAPVLQNGDSGSAFYTASWEDYVTWCNFYGVKVRSRRPDLPPDPPAGMLLFSCDIKYGFPHYNGGGARYGPNLDYFGLADVSKLPMEIVENWTRPVTTWSQTLTPDNGIVLTSGTVSTVGTATTINLNDPINWFTYDGGLNGGNITITGGKGAGQTRVIVSYTGAFQLATISPEWTIIPDTTSAYSVSGIISTLNRTVTRTSNTSTMSVSFGWSGEINANIISSSNVDLSIILGPSNSFHANITSSSNVELEIIKLTVVDLSTVQLVAHVVPTDITQINFDIVGYLREIDVFASITTNVSIGLIINEAIVTPLQISTNSVLNMPVSISLAINTGGAIQLSAISPIDISTIVGVSVNAVTVLELSANAPIGIQTSVNLTVNEKGFIEISTSLPINIQTSINLTVNECGFIEISTNLPINIHASVGLKILNHSQLIITHRSSKYIITEMLDKYNFVEMINKYIIKEDD